MSKLRTIIESHLYAEQAEKLGAIPRLDDVLAGVMWALARGAEKYFQRPHPRADTSYFTPKP